MYEQRFTGKARNMPWHILSDVFLSLKKIQALRSLAMGVRDYVISMIRMASMRSFYPTPRTISSPQTG
jgi:hypothetical protein